jgi:hypothetical protein
VLKSLNAGNHATAVEIARIPEQIKGFGHVKERHLKAARQAWSSPDGGVPCPPGRASGRLNGAQRRAKTTFMIRMASAQRRMALVSY